MCCIILYKNLSCRERKGKREGGSECVCVCVCMCVREREREKVHKQ